MAAGLMLMASVPVLADDIAAGETLFRANCLACHSTEGGTNRVGPSLFGVVGRPAGSVSSYIYSTAMKNAGLAWTEDQLDLFLTAPQKRIPGIKMSFLGLKDAAQRAAVIAYLKTRR